MMRILAAILWLLLPTFAAAAYPGSRLDALRENLRDSGFARATHPIEFEFPRDHGPHSEFRHEWWYVTGHLAAENGERFGFELTFFRYALAPPRALEPQRAGSAWRANQIYLAHFAVTDLERRKFHFAQRYSRDSLGLAGARSPPLRVWLENWHLELSGATGSLHAASEQYQIQLALRPLLDPVLNGDRGLSRKSRDAASYYYSIPRIAVNGRISRTDGPALEVSGLAWLDREWGSGALGNDQQGWDWFALHLDDGSALMFYALRRRDGTSDPFSAGTWVAPDGIATPLTHDDVELEPIKQWKSPRGGIYPSAWRLRVPALALDVGIQPFLADQELDTNPRYWEGAVAVDGRRGARRATGKGYVELVGYAQAPDRDTMPHKSAPLAPYQKGRSQ